MFDSCQFMMESEYLKTLLLNNRDVSERYRATLNIINGFDPFAINIEELNYSIDGVPPVTNMDIISYLVLTHSFYSKDQMKAFKSLQAYKYFDSGFVVKAGTKVINDLFVLVEKLRCDEQHQPMDFRRKITLHVKDQKYFNPLIKTSNWEFYPLSRPIDHDPFCPEKYNLQTSHYDRLGIEKRDKWTTVTGEMSKHIFDKKRRDLQSNPNKSLLNISSSIEPEEPKQECLADDYADYITTMQSHYPPPYGYPLKGTMIPETPFLANRRLTYPPGKFIDDHYMKYIKQMQCSKVHRHVSYNPMTGNYTDGKPGYVDKNKCVDFQKMMENYKI